MLPSRPAVDQHSTSAFLSFAPSFAPLFSAEENYLLLPFPLSFFLSLFLQSPLLVCLLGPSPTSGGPTRRPFGQPIPSKVCYTTRRTFENGLPPPSKLFLAPSLARLSSLARFSLCRQRNRGGCDARFIALSLSLSSLRNSPQNSVFAFDSAEFRVLVPDEEKFLREK